MFCCFKSKIGLPTPTEGFRRKSISEESDPKYEILRQQIFDRDLSYQSTYFYEIVQNPVGNKFTFSLEFDPLQLTIDLDEFVNFTFEMFSIMGCFSIFEINESRFCAFLRDVGQLYKDAANPYHNIKHAIHVLQNMFVFIKITNTRIDVYTIAAMLATLCHDIDHCGCTNQYLNNTRNAKAIASNGFSPQEMHHISTTFKLINKHDIFGGSLLESKQVLVQQCITNYILATNIAEHVNFLNKFQSSKKTHVLKLFLKCCDLSHVFAPNVQHIEWVKMLQKEFFIQGDKEKFHNIELTKMFDRDHENLLLDTQLQFFQTIVLPLFEILFSLYPIEFRYVKDNIAKNMVFYKTIHHHHINEMGHKNENERKAKTNKDL